MAINDVQYIKLRIKNKDLPELLLGLSRSLNSLLCRPVNNETLESFFEVFNEGSKRFDDKYFFVQTRLKKGRIGFSYDSSEDNGELKLSIYDNGEKLSEEEFNNNTRELKKYLQSKNISILEEGTRPEY